MIVLSSNYVRLNIVALGVNLLEIIELILV